MLYLLGKECYTEGDMDEVIKKSKGKLARESFKKIDSADQLKYCIDEIHPYCHSHFNLVNNYVYRFILTSNISREPQVLFTEELHDILFDLEDPYLGWKPIDSALHASLIIDSKKKKNIDILLKCLARRHVYLLKVSVRDDSITSVEVVDTSPIIVNPEMLLKRVKYILKRELAVDAKVKITLNEYADKHIIQYADDIVNLQIMEKSTLKFGMCNAWILFFSFAFVNGMDFDKVFEKLLASKSSLNTTMTIIGWWNDMFRKSEKLI